MENENYQDWTPCEWSGHRYETSEENPRRRRCVDCGESYEDDANESHEDGAGLDR